MTPRRVDAGAPRHLSLLTQYAATEEHVGDLETMALLTASVPMRDIFAMMATDRTWTYDQLHSWLHGRPGPVSRGTGVPDLNPGWIARLARVIALQNLRTDDLETALRLYRIVHARGDLSAVTPEAVKTFCNLLLWAGADLLLDELLPSLRLPAAEEQQLRTDLENPHRGGPRAKPEPTWRRRFIEVARFPAGTTLGPTDGERPFDQLHTTTQPVSRPRARQLVTVIMNVYRPDGALRGAVRSMLDQTWDELEVVIVDDGSGGEFADIFGEVTALDERVRLITLDKNVGAYGARNVALDHARGTYVTFQDYDDWSLPQRLELQVEPLEADRSILATRAQAASFFEDLTLGHPSHDHLFQIAAATLLFRRAEVMLGIGYFDNVRKGADNEYRQRIVAHFGRGSCLDLPSNSPSLMALRRTAGSLSHDEFRPGWWHPDRSTYSSNYRYWHRTARPHELFVPKDATRRFPAPNSFLRDRPPLGALDVVVVADVRPYVPHAQLASEIVATCVHEGLAVGVHRATAIGHPMRPGPGVTDDLMGLVHEGRVELVHDEVDLQTRLVIVLGPAVLQFADPTRTNWETDEAWIVDPHMQPDVDHEARPLSLFIPDKCRQIAAARFGVRPLWINGASAIPSALAVLSYEPDTSS